MLEFCTSLIDRIRICTDCQGFFRKGVQYLSQRRFSDAIKVFESIATYGQPEFASKSCEYLVEYHRKLGEQRIAVEWMERQFALELSVDLSFGIAECFRGLGDSSGELRWVLETVAHCPSFMKCYLRAAELLRADGKWTESLRILEGGFKALPESDEILKQMGELC